MFKWVTVFKTLTWDVTSRNGQRQAWWPKSAATPFPRKIGSPVKTAFWRFFFTSVCRCFACFILTLRESFNSRFQEGFTIHIKKTRTLGIRLLTTSARLYFRRSLGPPQEEKERGLISRTAACKSSRGIAPRLPPFQIRPSKSRLFRSQLTDSGRKQKNTQNPNRLWPREKSCFV